MAGMRHRYLQAFHEADKDGNGELTRDELSVILNQHGIPPSDSDVS